MNVTSSVDFEAVFPAVLQCFAIIACGYLSRRFNLIGSEDTKGLRTLMVYFLMPTMIAQAILSIHWEKVNWRFIACVFIAKTFVFVAVAAVTLALSNDLAKAGIYGIFASQSNDMALGCPLIKALYKSSHPEYLDYVYLLLPVSLVILNPIGFVMMEIETQQRRTVIQQHNRWAIFRRVLFGVAKNPMIISTLIGLVGSAALGHRRLPSLVDTILDGFSMGFVTVALFTLGCTLLSHGKPDAHYPLWTALLLSLAKILLLPLLLRELVSLANIGRSEGESSSLSIFGFLYGSLPTAPTVFVFACHYNVAVKQISTALALVTVLSAPWVFLSSKMISISHIDKAEYISVYSLTETNVVIIGTVTALICIVVYIASSKIRRVLHLGVFYILISALIACTGILIGKAWKDDEDQFLWRRIALRTLVLYGELGLRLFAVLLALSMTILRSVGLCMVLRLRTASVTVGFCLPLFVALSVVASAEMAHNDGVSKEEFDMIKAYVTAVTVTLCLVSNIVLLICQYKCGSLSVGCVHSSSNSDPIRHRISSDPTPVEESDQGSLSVRQVQEDEIQDIEDAITATRVQHCNGCNERMSGAENGDETNMMDKLRLLEPSEEVDDSEEPSTSGLVRPMCPSTASCTIEQRHKCKRLLRQYIRKVGPTTTERSLLIEQPESEDNIDEISGDLYEITKHSFLVAFLCISMTVSLFVALWRSVQRELNCGTYLQLRLLDVVLFYGQPVVILFLFGLDGNLITRIRKRLRRVFYGSEKLILPPVSNIDQPTRAVCEQFSRYHQSHCSRIIAKTVRSTLSVQENVFRGVDLVDWLCRHGIADGRAAAVKYSRRLVLGRVIEHIDQEEHFYDTDTLFYRFLPLRSHQEQLLHESC